jgi:predicted kinase
LPGVGKTTIACELAAPWIDTIEHAISSSNILSADADMRDTGYLVAYQVADDNLRLGSTVIADSVNPIALTRNAYKSAAERAGVRCFEIEIVCSNQAEHRHREENRDSDVPGLQGQSWREVLDRNYEVWSGADLSLDTASMTVAECVETISTTLSELDQAGR